MVDFTTYQAWEYPVEYSDPWYDELLAMFQSIDENTAKHRSTTPAEGAVQLTTTDSGKAFLLLPNDPSSLTNLVTLPETIENGSRFYFFSTDKACAVSSGASYIEVFTPSGSHAVANYDVVASYGKGCYLELVGIITVGDGGGSRWFVAGGRGVWVFMNTGSATAKTISFDAPVMDGANNVWTVPDWEEDDPNGSNTISADCNYGIVNGLRNIVSEADGVIVSGYDNIVGSSSRAASISTTQGNYAENHWYGSKTYSNGRQSGLSYLDDVQGFQQCGTVHVFGYTISNGAAVLSPTGNDVGGVNPYRLNIRPYSSIYCHMILVARAIQVETDITKCWDISWLASSTADTAQIVVNSVNETITGYVGATEDLDITITTWAPTENAIKISVVGMTGNNFLWSGKIDFTEVYYPTMV